MLKNYLIIDDKVSADTDDLWADKLLASIKQVNHQNITHRLEFATIQPILEKLESQAKILDGGCGRGEWTVGLTNLGFNIKGIDNSIRIVNQLKELYPQCQFNLGDVCCLPIESGSIDLYFSWGVFEHFEIGIAPCLKEAARVLNTHGELVFSVPFANGRQIKRYDKRLMHDYFNSGNSGKNKMHRFYQWRFTIGELYRELELSNFRVNAIHPIDKDEGVRRMLKRVKLAPGSFLETLVVRTVKKFISSNYISHMLIVKASKR